VHTDSTRSSLKPPKKTCFLSDTWIFETSIRKKKTKKKIPTARLPHVCRTCSCAVNLPHNRTCGAASLDPRPEIVVIQLCGLTHHWCNPICVDRSNPILRDPMCSSSLSYSGSYILCSSLLVRFFLFLYLHKKNLRDRDHGKRQTSVPKSTVVKSVGVQIFCPSPFPPRTVSVRVCLPPTPDGFIEGTSLGFSSPLSSSLK
jgi:hypothetical protein